MSKLSQLKQDAYQAGKKRDWESAVSIYERILELDKSNPSLVNELGDLCLKAGNIRAAVKHFLSAAAKYRTNGLLNNAVAIYKKILRHDDSNLNAHWYLAETRASQGLLVEGEGHGVMFLENSANITGDIKEIFLKRCLQLFELFPDSTQIMERLLQIFRMWEMHIESARVSCILGCQNWDSGEEDKARESVDKVISQTPDIVKYPEYSAWMNRSNPQVKSEKPAYSDINALDLGSASSVPEEPVAGAQVDARPVVETPVVEVPAVEVPVAAAPTAETSFFEISVEKPAVPEIPEIQESTAAKPEQEEPWKGISLDPELVAALEDESDEQEPSDELGVDEEGCFSLDTDTGVSFDALISEATAGVPDMGGEDISTLSDPFASSDEALEADMPEIQKEAPVDLLAEILADDSNSFGPAETNQEATITEEIGAKVGAGGDDADGASLYEMGLVYLEMDMFPQACDSFAKAVGDPDYAIRAHEMWGITLVRSNQLDEAVKILTAGLDLAEEGSNQQLGLLYHLGCAHENAGRLAEAEQCFKRIHDLDHTFLDVGKRLAGLSRV